MGATESAPPAGSRAGRRRTATSARARPDAPAAGYRQPLRSASTTAPPHTDSPHTPTGHPATRPPGHPATRQDDARPAPDVWHTRPKHRRNRATGGPRRTSPDPAWNGRDRPRTVRRTQTSDSKPEPDPPAPASYSRHAAHRHDAWAAVSARRPLQEMRARGTLPDPCEHDTAVLARTACTAPHTSAHTRAPPRHGQRPATTHVRNPPPASRHHPPAPRAYGLPRTRERGSALPGTTARVAELNVRISSGASGALGPGRKRRTGGQHRAVIGRAPERAGRTDARTHGRTDAPERVRRVEKGPNV